ncbi:MAG: hypothetical protein U9O24_05410 [Campylobacterota bacterium]|nr:hypothetical protein [Campylobacterota bacterium]
MTSNDMNQIRDLLIGEFSKEVKDQLKLLDDRLTQLHEDNKRKIEETAKMLETKINKVHAISQERNKSLKLLLEEKMNEQNSITKNEFTVIENTINAQNESHLKSVNLLKNRLELRLNSLEEDNIRKNVSKDSLASMFLEYSLKLKDTSITNELKDKML